MIKVKRIDHVAIALPEVTPGQDSLLSLFDLIETSREHVPDQKVDVAFLQPPGATTALELVAPAGNDSLQRFVDKRGSALHHVCFEVEDLAHALETLRAAGIPLVDHVPRRGARGHLVAFIHPNATGGVLFELCQHAQGDPRS
jgi:methylmalonyl-CoA/ethylmalonyl-CoA epimerase